MQIHGVSVNFGVYSTIVGVNGLFQSRDHHFVQDKDLIKDGGETTVAIAYWDQHEEATFTYVAYQPIFPPVANATVNIPTLGGVITIVDTRYPRIAGNWFVDDIETSNSNVTSVRVTLKISRYPFVVPNNPNALFPSALKI
jgi:hypothetical protein